MPVKFAGAGRSDRSGCTMTRRCARGLGRPHAKGLAEFDEKIVIERTLAVYAELVPQA